MLVLYDLIENLEKKHFDEIRTIVKEAAERHKIEIIYERPVISDEGNFPMRLNPKGNSSNNWYEELYRDLEDILAERFKK